MTKSIFNSPTLIWRRLVAICVLPLLLMPYLALAHDTTEPKILMFKIIPEMVKGEMWYQYYWEVVDADHVKLYKDGKEVLSRESYSSGEDVGWSSSMSNLRTKLNKSVTYRLYAENESGENTSKEFMVDIKRSFSEVSKKPQKKKLSPKILSFRVTPTMPNPGDFVQFHWDVENADIVRLYDDLGEIDLRTKHQRDRVNNSWFSSTINETTQFRLEAYNVASKKVIKTFTVQVDKPIEPAKTCSISGRLTGKWRQEVREKLSGPLSTWIVPVYIYTENSSQAFAKARVSNNGTYYFPDLKAGQTYKIRPTWASTPEQAKILCSANPSEGAVFSITGKPLID
ncbi:MAG: hypothetical protein JKX81_16550 [Arenicella sp.]|nr:hypothetical protein [Arenicella sp.]